MITKLSKAIKAASMPLIVLMGFAVHSYADDTEIYFSTDQKKVKPNILFILDKSGSMTAAPSGIVPTKTNGEVAKIDLLKESIQLIFTDPSISGMRVGLMSFSDYPILEREVVDIDEIDETRNIENLNPQNVGGDKTKFQQRVWLPTDDGYQNVDTSNVWYIDQVIDIRAGSNSGNRFYGFRFDNILLKNTSGEGASGESAPNYGIDKAELQFYAYTDNYMGPRRWIRIYVDPVGNSQYFRQRYKFDLSQRVQAAKNAGSDYWVDCHPLPDSYGFRYVTCDVTKLVRKVIAKGDWKGGNAISFIFENATSTNSNTQPAVPSGGYVIYAGSVYFSEYQDGQNRPYLNITAKNNAIALNKRTRKEAIMDSAFAIKASGGTYVNYALLAASKYISNIAVKKVESTTRGPYHVDGGKTFAALTSPYRLGASVKSSASPLVEGCQLTHFIFMSDGQPASVLTGHARTYMTGNASGYCMVNGVREDPGNPAGQSCGRALVYWMTKTNHSTDNNKEDEINNFKGPNYIYTHAISFGMSDDEGKTTTDKNALKYLQDLAAYGHGLFRQTKDVNDLTAAFKSILSAALSINGTAVSGQVVATAKDVFKQRREAFYSIFQSQLMDYWPGNVKGFKLVYKKVSYSGIDTEIPVLSSWNEAQPAIDGSTGSISSGVSSAWSSGDGNNADAGGVVAQLPDNPASRNMFTFDGHSKKVINSSAGITTAQLGVNGVENAENVKRGLLDFIRGYTYNLGGSNVVGAKKIGDAITSGVTLVSYGCGTGQTITDCPYENLNLVGLSAANDGIFRSYNLTDGSTFYEIMPEQMLPLIKKLQSPAQLQEYQADPTDPSKLTSKLTTKSYGLDGRVIVYHDDINKDDYINNGETAYAFVAAGRGGAYIYGFDISNKTNPKLLWAKTKNDLNDLGDTWSEPVVGKIKIAGSITPVVIFGAGYDKSQSELNNKQPPARKNDGVGTAVYILNAATGTEIATIHEDEMTFSIPGGVATLKGDKDNPELITDLFFGDMGGQLWRFKINNSDVSGLNIVQPAGGKNGLIANISGTGVYSTRRFYQKPFIYDFSAEGSQDDSVKNMIAINIGSGYKAHPLVTGNEDRFYSIRVPKNPTSATTQPIEEKDLAVLTLNTTGADNYIETGGTGSLNNGFMIKLNSRDGEKVISNPYVVMGRVAFNTYIPDNSFNPTNCVPNTGKARYYIVDIVSGKNLLNTKFVESEVSTIPNDVTVYCSDNACSLVSGTHMLDGNKNNYDIGRGPDSGTKCTATTAECNPSNWAPKKDGNKGSGKIIKTSWTDLFDPNVK